MNSSEQRGLAESGAGPAKTAEPTQAPATGVPIGKIFGIPIYLDTSWFIIFLLITLSLRTQFVSQHPSWTPAQHWALGIITSVLFFGSVLFHELSHSVVALRFKIPVQSITLFIFGGVSRIVRDAPTAAQEFAIAIAGPLSSFFLAGCFWLLAHYVHSNEMVAAAAGWLWPINLMLAVFNLVPGFPLDGGRVFRGIVWGITGNFDRATKIASTVGKAFAYLMIMFGVWRALEGNFIGGLWIAFIGWFLLSAARQTYAQVTIRTSLTGVLAGDIMSGDIPTVARDISIDEYVHEVLRTGQKVHVVTGAGKPVGLATLSALRSVPRDEWANTSIQAVMLPLDKIHSAAPEEPALGVFERMQQEDINQMPVISEGNIVGMVARDAIMRVLQTRLRSGHLAPH
jgi:Zn-dependent protease/predicted transcriptional regulator